MTSVGKCNKLELFPLDDGYICSMNVDNSSEYVQSLKQRLVQTVIILDRSGSMGQSVHRVVNEVLPVFFQRLQYRPDDIIHLITFDSVCELLTQRVGDFGKLPLNCRGCTNMTLAVHKFKELFSTFDMNIPVRVLTISDGDVDSQTRTKQAGDDLAKFVSDFQVPINSQAMRLFTSQNQPDTTALCSMLQINNTISTRLLDASAYSLPECITPLVELFSSDGLSNGCQMTAEIPAFLNLPWENDGLQSIIIRTGQNVFWMKKPIPKDVRIEGQLVNVILEPSLSHAKFYSLLSHKIPFIVDNMKILRVLGTEKASETAKTILEYFNKAEDSFAVVNEEPTDNDMNLKARVRKMIASRRKTFSNLLANIANDDNVSKLNSAQKADYLRQVDMSQNSRGLARRAAKEGLNFDEIARNEVLMMAKHFDSIADIDDTSHEISFFSQDTTLGGIKTLVELSHDENFETFSVHEILEILNLVGVACSGPIGDYPDASTWKVKEIFLGCYISLSDILVAYGQSNGESLRVPAIDKEITNVIPVFDERIGNFLKKYAPSLLEYTFSIGMRRIIADVPMTIGYTMCAGVWKMFYELNKSKSSLHLEIFKKFITTFDNFVGRYFDHIKPLLREQKSEKKMFYLANNGIANMMSPLIRMHKENDEAKLKLIPAILRSLYSFEIWHGIRRLYKNSDDADQICHSILYKLLGIDMSKKVTVKPPFIEEPRDIKFFDEPNRINYEYLDELIKPQFFVNYLTLIPKYLKATIADSDAVRDILTLSKSTILNALGIEYEYKEFMLFNVFQAVRYRTRASREDTDSEEMKIADPKDYGEAMKEVRGYIREQFENDYNQQLQQKVKIENERMGEHVASKILGAETADEMISMWRHGLIRNNVTYKISSPSSPGFKTLLQDVFASEKIVPQRINIVKILLLGVDDKNEAVWNHGGVCFSLNLKEIKTNFLNFGTWAELNAIMAEYKKKGKHIYREHRDNRHGHGNEKPSFWAMGYSTMVEYRGTVSPSEFLEYCKNHRQCCGVRNLENDFLISLNDDT